MAESERDERLALIAKCGILTGRVMLLTGHLPRVILEHVEREDGLDFEKLTNMEIAAMCAAIRAECPEATWPARDEVTN